MYIGELLRDYLKKLAEKFNMENFVIHGISWLLFSTTLLFTTRVLKVCICEGVSVRWKMRMKYKAARKNGLR